MSCLQFVRRLVSIAPTNKHLHLHITCATSQGLVYILNVLHVVIASTANPSSAQVEGGLNYAVMYVTSPDFLRFTLHFPLQQVSVLLCVCIVFYCLSGIFRYVICVLGPFCFHSVLIKNLCGYFYGLCSRPVANTTFTLVGED